jgi:hypothetical protein
MLKGAYLRSFKSFSYFHITTVMEFIEDLFRYQNLFWTRVILTPNLTADCTCYNEKIPLELGASSQFQ